MSSYCSKMVKYAITPPAINRYHNQFQVFNEFKPSMWSTINISIPERTWMNDGT